MVFSILTILVIILVSLIIGVKSPFSLPIVFVLFYCIFYFFPAIFFIEKLPLFSFRLFELNYHELIAENRMYELLYSSNICVIFSIALVWI